MTPGGELLAHARGLICFAWTQYAEARDADGQPVDPWEGDAMSWSLLGALVAGYQRLLLAEGERAALEELVRVSVLLSEIIDCESLPGWNDAAERTQADVLAALDATARRRLALPRSA